jgi:PPM family protein phosphatase
MSPDPMCTPAAPSPAPLTIRYAAASDQGLVRDRNQDVAYADSGMVVVADGFGPAGGHFGAAVIDSLRQYTESVGPAAPAPAPADVLNAMSDAVASGVASVRSVSDSEESVADSGSTLTAMFWYGSQLAFVHIGDSRAYLLRDGGLFQITHDDTVVQSMIDSGRLTPEEAVSHPQRSMLVKALDPTARTLPEPTLRDAQAGDRYLLCSDGLTTVVPVAAIRQTLSDATLSPDDVVARMIAAANAAGGPDNIACAVADVTAAA